MESVVLLLRSIEAMPLQLKEEMSKALSTNFPSSTITRRRILTVDKMFFRSRALRKLI